MASDQSPTANTKPVVLIVDDMPSIIELLSRWLQDEYSVHVAHSGLDAIKLADEVRPQIALIDILMARPNGFEIAETLRAQPQHAGLPIIFMTGLARAENAAQATRIGAVDLLEKPLDRNVVLASLRRALKVE